MKIVSWNCSCSGGFNKEKVDTIQEYPADIFVIQECTFFDCIRLKSQFANVYWYGDGKDSVLGIGVFSHKYQFEFAPEFNRNHRYVVPYRVIFNGKKQFTLIAVWTKQINSAGCKYENYQVPVFAALKEYVFDKSAVIGDFNTGANKSDTNKWYSKLETETGKYKLRNCASNEQKLAPTFFRGDSILLDDHCFVTNNLRVKSFEIGTPEDWIKPELSDHCPIIVDFDW
ncbi:endonuclease/exonuclease/phosphatase family protein [Treponema endosymbiont of Eucomonympha sp.]|uniref:endonuclease/exonuclease/phosphatase family protein n=1 Tax=Treponema endosymbiont of Eucomonympha sp. TaxID=1580831 RepID=UPI0007867C38|nr:endonuclease/exonuclease/phosphatase family protein [Treponema endosymbiont of Eucomonympha sp.]